MKLKLVVASMSMASLIAFPGLAAAHGKHHHRHHHFAKKETVEAVDYKAMGALPVVEACPIMDPYTVMLDGMDHNTGRAKPTEDCNKLISFAGGINFDAHWGNRSMGYQGENNQRLSLNDAYLNVYGIANDWTRAFMSLSYNDVSDSDSSFRKMGVYSNVTPPVTLTMEQAFVRFSNFEQTPFFVQLGKQYQDFGKYNIHPITRSMDQVMSETLRTSAEVGFLTQIGFHGSAWAFDNPLRQRSSATVLTTSLGHSQTDWGIGLGIDRPSDQLGWDLGVDWMYNMTGVNDMAYAISQFEFGTSSGGNYRDNTGAVAVYGDVNSGPFSLLARYVTATSRFNKATLLNHLGGTQGAQPWAGNIQADFGFTAWNRSQNIYLGYQASGDAVYIFLPKSRWTAGYNIDVMKNTMVGAEYAYDHDYSTGHGGTGLNSSTFAVRVGVKFG